MNHFYQIKQAIKFAEFKRIKKLLSKPKFSKVDTFVDENKENLFFDLAERECVEPELVSLLVEKGVNPNQKNKLNIYPLQNAIFKANISAVNALVNCEKVDLNCISNGRNTLLHYVVKVGNHEVTDCLVRRGVNVNTQNNQGNSPLWYAKEEKTLTTLIKNNADLELKNNKNETVIFDKVRQKDSQSVGLLIAAGCSLKSRNENGATPCHIAAEAGGEMLPLIINSAGKESLNARDNNGNTPVHYTLHSESPVVNLKLLVEAGANPDATNNKGNTVLHEYVKQNAELNKDIINQYAEVVNPNIQNNKGEAPLHLVAAVKDDGATFTAFASNPKVNTSITNNKNQTPLVKAKSLGRDNILSTFHQFQLQILKTISGDLEISLSWFNKNDLDLWVETPNEETICYSRKRASCGGNLDIDQNCNSMVATSTPVELVSWAGTSAPRGKYRVFVNYFKKHFNDEVNSDPTEFVVYITLAKEPLYQIKSSLTYPGDGKLPVCEFNYTEKRTIEDFTALSKLKFEQLRVLHKNVNNVLPSNVDTKTFADQLDIF